MPKAKNPVNDSVPIAVSEDKTLWTVVDPQTGKHSVKCDLCSKVIHLTVTANTDAFLQHRRSKKCVNVGQSKNIALKAIILGALSSSSLSIPFDSPPPSPTSRKVSSLQKSLSQTLPCSGITVKWLAGSIWSTYPFRIHDTQDLLWTVIGINESESTITFCSKHCQNNVYMHDGTICLLCYSIPTSTDFRNIEARAKHAHEHTPWGYLTSDQMDNIMRQMAAQIRKLQSQKISAVQRYGRTNAKVDDYKCMTMMIANNDIIHLKQLMAASLKHGSSTTVIIKQLQRAIDGIYTPSGSFTTWDLDIALIVLVVGGPRLLYTMQKSHGLPSLSTVCQNNLIPHLFPSIGEPQSTEINLNISAFFDPSFKPPPLSYHGMKLGNTLMFDGVAIESKCRYCPRRQTVMGLCREHVHRVDPRVTTPESIEIIGNTLFHETDPKKKVCFGVDATVVAVASYGRSDFYNAIPIVLSPSDKTEKSDALSRWITVVLKAWSQHKFGEKLSGPIWSIASDGDATFRRARHDL